MSVDDYEPNPLFVAIPSPEDVASALNDAGIDTCDCEPKKCSSIVFKDIIEEDEKDNLVVEITAAYLMANPSLEQDDIIVEISKIDAQLADSEE